MPAVGTVRAAAVLLAVLVLAACAEPPAAVSPPSDSAPPPRPELPADPGALVLRVEQVGGFVTPETNLSRVPVYSLYADGRLITDGPVPAIYPGPALPNVQVQVVDAATVQELADRALAAGVAETTDLGAPPLADVPSTRFTLVTAAETHVREVYALGVGPPRGEPDDGLTEEQRAGRAELQDLLAALADVGQQPGPGGVPAVEGYAATAVAAIARPWSAPADDVAAGLAPDPVPWPGPPLPGVPVGGLPVLGCVTATGDQAAAVLGAARTANALTPWSTPDGALWSVTFRPLLPDESDCADLRD
jgi:hypothetical protein